MKRIHLLLLVIVLAIGLLGGCQSKENAETPLQPAAEIEDEKSEEEFKETFLHTFPLTGVGTNDEVGYRPFGVMIENSKSARPQSGLYQADLVYEVLSEASITRYLAFYHSEHPEIIGPVRSARDYYIHLNNGYNGIYVSAGGSPKAFAMVQARKVDYISGLDYDGRYFTRSSARKAPHNLYTSYEQLVKASEHAKLSMSKDLPQLPFHEEGHEISGVAAEKISINYGSNVNNALYEYDPKQQKYLRYTGGEQVIDNETKQPVQIDNIFIVEAKHRIIDDVGRREVEIDGGGRGLLLQQGVMNEVQWKNVGGQILPANTRDRFVQGKTWISFVPKLNDAIVINE